MLPHTDMLLLHCAAIAGASGASGPTSSSGWLQALRCQELLVMHGEKLRARLQQQLLGARVQWDVQPRCFLMRARPRIKARCTECICLPQHRDNWCEAWLWALAPQPLLLH